jgi:hypothetical protein
LFAYVFSAKAGPALDAGHAWAKALGCCAMHAAWAQWAVTRTNNNGHTHNHCQVLDLDSTQDAALVGELLAYMQPQQQEQQQQPGADGAPRADGLSQQAPPLVACPAAEGLRVRPLLDARAARHWLYPKNLPVRPYQFDMAAVALRANTLVALPTGLGKTFVAAVVMLNYYRWFPEVGGGAARRARFGALPAHTLCARGLPPALCLEPPALCLRPPPTPRQPAPAWVHRVTLPGQGHLRGAHQAAGEAAVRELQGDHGRAGGRAGKGAGTRAAFGGDGSNRLCAPQSGWGAGAAKCRRFDR